MPNIPCMHTRQDSNPNGLSGTFLFERPDGERLVPKTGDHLTLGGYQPWDEDATDEPAAPPWLVQPGPDCPRALMLVHSAHRGD